jgi:hypothetical protein
MVLVSLKCQIVFMESFYNLPVLILTGIHPPFIFNAMLLFPFYLDNYPQPFYLLAKKKKKKKNSLFFPHLRMDFTNPFICAHKNSVGKQFLCLNLFCLHKKDMFKVSSEKSTVFCLSSLLNFSFNFSTVKCVLKHI